MVENPKLMNSTIAKVMTANPISISSEAMAVDILKIIEKRKVDDILVVDPKGRAVGLIDVQDLPGFKLM
jgi:arabinose-5-phosphate isomerase